MERRLRRILFVSLLRFPAMRRGDTDHDCGRHKDRDFAITLMPVAVAGVICQAINALIDLGRSAGWWQ